MCMRICYFRIMSNSAGLNTELCLVWITSKPILDRPRYSPMFLYKGVNRCFKFEVSNSVRDKIYYLKINGEISLCSVVTTMKSLRSNDVLPYSSRETLCLWKYSESQIIRKIQHFHTATLLKFFITFDDGCINFMINHGEKTEKSLPKVEKSVQTPLYMNSIPCLQGDVYGLLNRDSSHFIELKCGDQTFSAHKNVLSSCSQVFARMLDSDMAEGRSCSVKIQDMDSQSFAKFLRYLYSGTLPELNVDLAKSLYEAGDKYAIEGLVKQCADFLTDNLTLQNACELLVLSNAHSDYELKENIIIYILNKGIPMQDENWLSFCNCHPKLANEVLNRYCKIQNEMLNCAKKSPFSSIS